MPLDRMPSISLGIIVRVGVVYDASYHWRTEAGELRASVGFQVADRAESAEDPANAVAVVEGVAQ
jgi:hypothetical protein